MLDKCKISVYARMLCLYSSVIIVAFYWLDDSRQRKGFFHVRKGQTCFGAHPTSYYLVPGALYSGVKRQSVKPTTYLHHFIGKVCVDLNLCFLPLCVSAVYTVILQTFWTRCCVEVSSDCDEESFCRHDRGQIAVDSKLYPVSLYSVRFYADLRIVQCLYYLGPKNGFLYLSSVLPGWFPCGFSE